MNFFFRAEFRVVGGPGAIKIMTTFSNNEFTVIKILVFFSIRIIIFLWELKYHKTLRDFWKQNIRIKSVNYIFAFSRVPQETAPSPKILLWISFNFHSLHCVTSHKTRLPWDLRHSCLKWAGNTKTKSWIQLTIGLPVCFPLSNICLDIAGMKMGAQGPSQFASTMRPTSPVHFRSYTSPGILSYPILSSVVLDKKSRDQLHPMELLLLKH